MDINATLIGQLITFAILVCFTMKYVWPPIMKAMEERESKIAEGLDAAERSKRELQMAEQQVANLIREAKLEATQIIERANVQNARMLEDAKVHAKEEGQRIVDRAQGEIEKEIAQAKEALRAQVVTLAIAGAEKVIGRSMDANLHRDLLNDLAAEI